MDVRAALAPNLSLRTRTAGLANHHGCPHHGALAEYVDTGASFSRKQATPQGDAKLSTGPGAQHVSGELRRQGWYS